MLEVNDFNAVRISLASPEQIRSWSYGEVTKPETINYRTLKPEKDGLFCERIFGPTRDFECYCGKYKRLRYKGIVCDKCGVEVARSKVRRERMGHIELAAPVAHIWFSKGTPSRIGLLLDISPRRLERVLYFASFIITAVNEEVRERTAQAIAEESHQEAARREQALAAKSAEIRTRWEEESSQRELGALAERHRWELETQSAVANITTQAKALEESLVSLLGKATSQPLSLAETVIAEAGHIIGEEDMARLGEEAQRQIQGLEDDFAQRVDAQHLLIEAETEHRKYQVTQEIASLQRKLVEEIDALEEAVKARIADLKEVKPLAVVAENRYRELKDAYSDAFSGGMGAEAILDILQRLDLNELRDSLYKEIQSTSGQRRKKATKRLRIVEAFRKSTNKPEWMILTVLPVLPPDLRPMVQLDGGRFATSDLNDLYRRVINRNNRLRRLLELGAPEIIIRNEKRMLQEAVDSLIDNGRRGRAVSTGGNHKLKSLSDMLRGKQGRFRQNLLGKRVDYSGRSVIVVGPELKLHQCGLPKRMALELFKPFVMHRLVAQGLAHNIKSAKRIVERVRPEVWDILEEVVKERPVLLNRAPTLHRLGIQAFEPVLIEGSAIQIHPLVCAAFNADFDGDQMAVHVPLSREAVAEARQLLLATKNLLSPSSGEPTTAATLDIVLGCYYLTVVKPGAKGEGMAFSNFEDAKLAQDLGVIDLQALVKVRNAAGAPIETSVGRIIFNEVIPKELGFRNQAMDRSSLKNLVAECQRHQGGEATATLVDEIKRVGFHYATQSGITIAISDIKVPQGKTRLLADADHRIAEVERQFQRGLITEEERYHSAVDIWTDTSERMAEVISQEMDKYGSIYMMATSGAKGNIAQIRQMAGMRGLMTEPSGRIIDLPIRSSFQEGLTVLEYFISTHGARKGLADTALRTADSGYLTRRLIDVSQDVIVNEDDCGTLSGIRLMNIQDKSLLESFAERITGRFAASRVVHPATEETLVERNQEIGEDEAKQILEAGVAEVHVRSPLSCQTKRGICRYCYGRSLGSGYLVNKGEAVGIIAAQSIGEPGTQLTMRTFHTGGVAGLDITSGLPRVEELFEARVPKGQSIISEIDGLVEIIRTEDTRKIRITNSEWYRDDYPLPPEATLLVADGDWVEAGTLLAQPAPPPTGDGEAIIEAFPILARIGGRIALEDNELAIYYEEKEEREYPVPATARILVDDESRVMAGTQLTEGSINPQDILRILGREAVQLYLVDEVQKVYRSQGVNINDKHIEVIVRQMLRKVRVDSPGDTDLLPGELVDRFVYEDINARVLAEGGEPATAQTVLLGVTKASLNTASFLAAASFQETTRVLTEAAVMGSTDRLQGLKENVIIGKLIPARTAVLPSKEDLLGMPLESGALAEGEEVAADEEGDEIYIPNILGGPGALTDDSLPGKMLD